MKTKRITKNDTGIADFRVSYLGIDGWTDGLIFVLLYVYVICRPVSRSPDDGWMDGQIALTLHLVLHT